MHQNNLVIGPCKAHRL